MRLRCHFLHFLPPEGQAVWFGFSPGRWREMCPFDLDPDFQFKQAAGFSRPVPIKNQYNGAAAPASLRIARKWPPK
jgi:hypothetical protein